MTRATRHVVCLVLALAAMVMAWNDDTLLAWITVGTGWFIFLTGAIDG